MTRRPIPAISDDQLAPILTDLVDEAELPVIQPAEIAQAQRAAAQWEQWCADYEAVGMDHANVQVTARHATTRVAASEPGVAPRGSAAPQPGAELQPDALPVVDATAIPFVTIDPSGSRDLDQAVAFERVSEFAPDIAANAHTVGAYVRAFARPEAPRTPSAKINTETVTDSQPEPQPAYLVHYAIASPATFIAPDSPLDRGVWERGLTTYLPGRSLSLHPVELSHGAASLLPGALRPACWWRLWLAADGRLLAADVRRAVVRSRVQLSYRHCQKLVDGTAEPEGDTPHDLPVLIAQVGRALLAQQDVRGGVSARIPEQEITAGPTGYRLTYRAGLPVEEWNAQVSLLTGMAAAALMELSGIGILRTVPPASDAAIAELRRVAKALDLPWAATEPFAQFQRNLDADDSAVAAFLMESTSLFRGSGYLDFDERGRARPDCSGPAESVRSLDRSRLDPRRGHAAIAAHYAHATAPLRRLVDRYSSELALAASACIPPPQWVVDALPELPAVMARASQRISGVDRRVLRALQALILEPYVGYTFTGVVVDRSDSDPRLGRIMVQRPAVMGKLESSGADLPLGERVHVELARVDVQGVTFTLEDSQKASETSTNTKY